MTRSITSALAPATITVAEDLLARVNAANAQEPYVAADYDLPANALMAVLVDAFGEQDAQRVRECTYDGHTIRSAVAYVTTERRAAAADDYDTATAQQAETDALRAFDAITQGWCVEDSLRAFAAATDHLEAHGMVLALDLGGASVPRWADRDDADAKATAAAHLVTV